MSWHSNIIGGVIAISSLLAMQACSHPATPIAPTPRAPKSSSTAEVKTPASAPATTAQVQGHPDVNAIYKPVPAAPPVSSEAHKRGLALAAKAAADGFKHPQRAIDEYKLALKEEPGNREWLSLEAFWLARTGRTGEAQPIWNSLATDGDEYGMNARSMLKKSSGTVPGN